MALTNAAPKPCLRFGPFRLDRQYTALWKDDERLALRPQSLSVLQYLAERPRQVVPAQELRAHLWSDTHVTDTVLRVCIRDIRRALQDPATQPQYVQTVRGQGYRFCGMVEAPSPARHIDTQAATPQIRADPDQTLSWLKAGFQRAAGGERQVLLLSSETGLGKTTMIETFLASLSNQDDVHIGRGQGVELTGPAEPFWPILEALGQMGREPGGEQLVSVLRQAAPTWLVHLPMLVPEAGREALQRQVQGSNQARMRRELIDALDIFTAQRPLVLVLEDLHWSDPFTIDVLAMLARRRTPARLFLLGSFCPMALQSIDHPLSRLLQALQEHRESYKGHVKTTNLL